MDTWRDRGDTLVKLYVEGGGDAAILKTECRKGFSEFIKKFGISKMPRVVACGGRQNAYESYRTAIDNGEEAFLLVDAEDPIDSAHQEGDPINWKPWAHLNSRNGDKWEKPSDANDTDCHLMAQVMESWFVADRLKLKQFYGTDFKVSKLPLEGTPIESIVKKSIYSSLSEATKTCRSKGQYGKGSHSFKILSEIDPDKVVDASPWAKRFLIELRKRMDT